MKYIFLLFLINFQSLFSQQHLIEYELTPRPIPVVEINKNSEYVRYHNSTTMKTLMYFDNEAFHFVVEPEEFQNINHKKEYDKRSVLILSMYRETYYNKNTNILCLKKIVQNEFGCEIQPKYEWNLTNETSTINGFKVYKAYIDEPYITRKGVERINQIIAWYCPDLPYNYAPMGIGGLPGLVLSLETHGSKYIAKKITLNHSKEKVKPPKEYEEFVKQ